MRGSDCPPIGADDLVGWNVTVYEALEAARQNLDETLEGYGQIGDGFYVVQSGDTYDAARLMLIDRIRGMEVSGRHVAMVPNRDTLLITGTEGEVGLTTLVAFAEDGLKKPYTISGTPLVLEDDGWHDWMPQPDHALYKAFRNLELESVGPDYTEQKKLLDALHAKQGIDIWVASFSAAKKSDRDRFSFCAWGEGVDALLPVTQRVAFMREGQEGPPALGDWERVREIAGDLMEETEHYPPRYRVREFPNQAMLDAMGVAEL